MYRYVVTKMWYDETEIIESDTPLSESEIMSQLNTTRVYCDQIEVEEETE